MSTRTSHLLDQTSKLFQFRDFNLKNPSAWAEILGGLKTTSGQAVTPTIALGLPVVYAAINTYANEMASLPLKVFRVDGAKKTQDTENNLHRLLNIEPNGYMTPFDYHYLMEAWKWAYGYSIAIIERFDGGEINQLLPVHPSKLTQIYLYNSELYYVIEGIAQPLNGRDIIHLRDLDISADSYKGKSRISICQEAIGAGIAVEKFGAAFFGNGANPGLVIKELVPGSIQNTEHMKALQTSLDNKYNGPDNSHNHIVLPPGLDLAAGPTMSNEQSQFIERQKFTITQGATIFNLPPNKLRDNTNLTYNNAEQENIGYIQDSIRPVAKKNEQEYTKKLTKYNEKGILKAKYSLESRMRGDMKTQTEHIEKMMMYGVYTVNDALNFLNRNAIGPEGDIRYIQGNMMKLGETMTPKKEQ